MINKSLNEPISHTQIVGLKVSDKFFSLIKFYYESMGGYDPHGVASLDHRVMVSRIYIGEHEALQHTNMSRDM